MTSPPSALPSESTRSLSLGFCLLLLTFVSCTREAKDLAATPEPAASPEPTKLSSPEPSIASDPPGQTSVEPMPVEDRTVKIDDAKTLLMQAGEALQAGNIQAAGRAIRQAVSIQPDDPQIVFTMAIVLGQEHRFPEAVMVLDKLSQEVPETRLPALGQTAEWLVIQGKWKEAELRFRKVLQEVPDAAMAHRQLAQLLLRQGQRHQAANHLQALCELGNVEEIELRAMLSHADPFAADLSRESLEPIGPLGQARWAISNDDWDRAASELTAADHRTPDESALLGRVHAIIGDMASLEKWAVDNADLTLADAWFARGVLAAHRSDHEAAVRFFCQVVLLDPTDHQGYERMSKSLLAMGSESEAKQSAERASWLVRSQEIGNAMAISGVRNAAKLTELVELLDRLRRPLESVCWRAVRFAYVRSELSTEQQRAEINDIKRRRSLGTNEAKTTPSENFICCGVDSGDR